VSGPDWTEDGFRCGDKVSLHMPGERMIGLIDKVLDPRHVIVQDDNGRRQATHTDYLTRVA
jgi:hypothetical protein